MSESKLLILLVACCLVAAALPSRADKPLQPDKAPADGAAVVTAAKLEGPYPSIDALCHDAVDDRQYEQCRGAERSCSAHGFHSAVAPPFRKARLLQFEGECHLALRTDAGWWLAPGREEPLGRFLNNGERYLSEIDDISPIVDGALVIRGTFINWNNPEKMPWLQHPAYDEWYECEQRVMICGVGDSQAVSCTPAIRTGYTTYCRDSEHPRKALGHRVSEADFELVPRATKTELRFETKGPQPTSRPPTGFETTALDAKERRHDRVPLPPRSIVLHFQ